MRKILTILIGTLLLIGIVTAGFGYDVQSSGSTVNINIQSGDQNLTNLGDVNTSMSPNGNDILTWDATQSTWTSRSAQAAGDTNETVRFSNLVNDDCPGGQLVIGVQANGTVLCATDATGAGGTYNATYDSFAYNQTDVYTAGSNITISSNVVSINITSLTNYLDTLYQTIGTYITGVSGKYLYTSGTNILLNETELNATIDDRASGLGDNSSWNETRADDLYVNSNGDNMTGNLNLLNNDLTNINSINFNITANETLSEGECRWNDEYKTLECGSNIAGVNALMSFETHLLARNNLGYTINKSQAVYISGAQGGNSLVSIAKADAESTSAGTIAVAHEDCSDNSNCIFIVSGVLENIDTSEFNAGNVLYLSAENVGGFTNVSPIAPNHSVRIGWVQVSNANTGKVLIQIQNGFEMDELHDAHYTQTLADGQVMRYNLTTSRWENINFSLIDTNETTRVSNLVGNCSAGQQVFGINSDGTKVCVSDATGAGGKDSGGNYLYNTSTTIYSNDTKLNNDFNQTQIILDNNASWLSTYNETYEGAYNASYESTYNATYDAITGGNGSFNESYTDTLYADIIWGYNQTYSGSTYNATYDSFAYNQTDIYTAGSNITISSNIISINITSLTTYLDTLYQTIGTYLTGVTGKYLYLSGTNVALNETELNDTITDIASKYNESALVSGKLDATDQRYNQTQIILDNNASWLSTYNETYEGVYNETYDSFAYNHTSTILSKANTFTENQNFSKNITISQDNRICLNGDACTSYILNNGTDVIIQ